MFKIKNPFKKVADVAAETDDIRKRIIEGKPVSNEELENVLAKRRELGMPNLDITTSNKSEGGVGAEGQSGPVR